MSVTLRVVNLVDKLRLQSFFVEQNNVVNFTLAKFKPDSVEKIIDKLLPTKGRKYKPSHLEIEAIRELERDF